MHPLRNEHTPEELAERRKMSPCAMKDRLAELELNVKQILGDQKEIAAQLATLNSVLSAAEGAFRVLEFLGRIAKPLMWISGLAAAIGAALHTKHP